jgi:hypothetical protein
MRPYSVPQRLVRFQEIQKLLPHLPARLVNNQLGSTKNPVHPMGTTATALHQIARLTVHLAQYSTLQAWMKREIARPQHG